MSSENKCKEIQRYQGKVKDTRVVKRFQSARTTPERNSCSKAALASHMWLEVPWWSTLSCRWWVSGDVTLKGMSFSERVFLLSPATHWVVLINTNGCHGCEELNSRSAKRVRNATNFATRLRSARADIQRPFRGVKNAPFFIAFKDLLALLDLFREISKS